MRLRRRNDDEGLGEHLQWMGALHGEDTDLASLPQPSPAPTRPRWRDLFNAAEWQMTPGDNHDWFWNEQGGDR